MQTCFKFLLIDERVLSVLNEVLETATFFYINKIIFSMVPQAVGKVFSSWITVSSVKKAFLLFCCVQYTFDMFKNTELYSDPWMFQRPTEQEVTVWWNQHFYCFVYLTILTTHKMGVDLQHYTNDVHLLSTCHFKSIWHKMAYTDNVKAFFIFNKSAGIICYSQNEMCCVQYCSQIKQFNHMSAK